MIRNLFNALFASLVLCLCLFVWRTGYQLSDWAALSLLPLAWIFWIGAWPFFLDPWRAKVSVVFQEGSILARILTGKIHAFFLSIIFVPAATILFAWQALTISSRDAVIALGAALLAGLLFQQVQVFLTQHLRQPFARNAAGFVATWSVAIPLTVVLAISFRSSAEIPGAMLNADLLKSIEIAMSEAPAHGGWVSEILAFPRAFDAAKLWLAITLRDYPVVAWLVSFDAALYSLLLCRAAVILTEWGVSFGLGKRKPWVGVSKWFWGAILTLAAVEAVLIGAAEIRVPAQPEVPKSTMVEVSAERMRDALNSANRDAVDFALAKVDPLLDLAYQPAYSAIPVYADFHYSLFGEYAELTAAAMGEMSGKLEEVVLAGFGPRLDAVGTTLDKDMTERFEAKVSEGLKSTPEIGLGPLSQRTMDELHSRLKITVPVSALAAVGGAVAVKTVAKVLADKIAVKMATKLAAKAAGKWATAGTGAGSGAVICSWSGPGAALCGIGGGVVAWVASDYAMVKMDELWTRDSFEADLRVMLDGQKAATREALRQALLVKAKAWQEASDHAVQQQAFSLRDLSGQGNDETCTTAAHLAALYAPMQGDLEARGGSAVAILRKELEPGAGDLILRPLVTEIAVNLDAAAEVAVTHVLVKGTLPDKDASGDDLSGVLVLNGRSFSVPHSSGGLGVDMRVPISGAVIVDQPFIFALSLEQEDWGRNSFFGTGGHIVKVVSSGLRPGLKQRVDFSMPIAVDPEASSVTTVSRIAGGNAMLDFGLILEAKELPALTKMPNCPAAPP